MRPVLPSPDQVQLGEILGQVAANRAKDPIQVAVALHLGALVGEIPHVLAPRLQLDKAQVGARADVHLDDPGVQGLARSRLGEADSCT